MDPVNHYTHDIINKYSINNWLIFFQLPITSIPYQNSDPGPDLNFHILTYFFTITSRMKAHKSAPFTQPQQGLLWITRLILSGPWGHCHCQARVSASSQLSKQVCEGSQWLTIPEERLERSQPTLSDWEKKVGREEWWPWARKDRQAGKANEFTPVP